MHTPPWSPLWSPPIDPPERADVVVVGGGLAGVATAALLAEGGARVALLESADTLGAGASGRHLGLATLGLLEHPWRLQAALGEQRSAELFQFSQRSVDLIPNLQRSGTLWRAADPKERADVEASAAALQAAGVQAILSEAGVTLPQSGRCDPIALLGHFADRARQAHAMLVTHCPVHSVQSGAAGLVVRAGATTLRAEVVIWAAGHHLTHIEPFFADKLTPVREQAICTTPRAEPLMPGRMGQGYTSWDQLPTGEVLVSGCRWATAHLEQGETNDQALSPEIQAKLEAASHHLGAPAELQRRWAWITTHTCDGLPILGPLPGRSRELACTGFNGNDLGLALAAAEATASGLLSDTPAPLPSIMAATRFIP